MNIELQKQTIKRTKIRNRFPNFIISKNEVLNLNENIFSLPRQITLQVYNRPRAASRIDGVKVWVGYGLTGGNYGRAELVGTIKYVEGTNPYTFSNLAVEGSSIQIQGGEKVLNLAEVEVYEGSFVVITEI